MTLASAPERIVVRLRPHARSLIVPVILLLAICAGLGYASGRLPEDWQTLAVAGLGAVIVLVGCLAPFLRWLSCRYTITTRRTVASSGVLSRVRRELPHHRAVEVTVRRGALQSLFGSGDVLVGVGSGPPFVLRDVPRPRLVAEALHELVASDADAVIG